LLRLVGVFVGAALLTRDLEVGTHRLVWTQGTPRSRWLATKLALVFGAVLPAGALVGVLTADDSRTARRVRRRPGGRSFFLNFG
jgi:hypothetical protein